MTDKTSKALDPMRERFDLLTERMQTPKARRAVRALFEATPAELGQAAVEAAREDARDNDLRDPGRANPRESSETDP